MGILGSIFGKKKKDSATPEVRVEPSIHEFQKSVVSAESRESLLKSADTGRPVVISGGDFSSKTVIIVSKPSKKLHVDTITEALAVIGNYQLV